VSSAGTVVSAGYSKGYGNNVVISHPDGRMTRYAHNSKLLVSAGQWVEQGQIPYHTSMNIFVQSAINLQTYRMVAYKHIIIVTIISFCQLEKLRLAEQKMRHWQSFLQP